MSMVLSLTFQPVQAGTPVIYDTSNQVPLKPDGNDEGACLMERLTEIKEMDKSNLTPLQKKNLRMEVRSIEKEMSVAGGLYISGGALIILIVILIILL